MKCLVRYLNRGGDEVLGAVPARENIVSIPEQTHNSLTLSVVIEQSEFWELVPDSVGRIPGKPTH